MKKNNKNDEFWSYRVLLEMTKQIDNHEVGRRIEEEKFIELITDWLK